MATPEGSSDMELYTKHQNLKQEMDNVVEEWESASIELDEAKSE